MILVWIAIFVLSIVLYIYVSVFNAWIEIQNWQPWLKTIIKMLVWLSAIVGTVVVLFIMVLFSGGGSNSKK